MDLLDLAKDKGLETKRTAAIGGGEYHCACPACGDGHDRFAIWPNEVGKNGVVGRYWCRRCDAKGDAIQFCRDFLDMTYREACEKLRVQPKEVGNRAYIAPKRSEFTPILATEPPPLWQEKAAAFVNWSHDQLLAQPACLEKLYERGFKLDAIKKFKLGFCTVEMFRDLEQWGLPPQIKENGNAKKLWLPSGFIIPAFGSGGRVMQIKVRRSNWCEGDELPKYVAITGGMRCPSIYGDPAKQITIVLESEFDGLLIQQQAGELCCSIALGGSTKRPDLYTDHLLRKASLILFCPDVDEAGASSLAWWEAEYTNLALWPAPFGKSPGDALRDHKVDLYRWILQGIPEALKQSVNIPLCEFICKECGNNDYWISIYNDAICMRCIPPDVDETLVKRRRQAS